MNNLKTANDIMNLLREIENKFRPSIWQIEGVDAWPILRVNLYYELSLALLSGQKQPSNRWKQLRRIFKAIGFSSSHTAGPVNVLLVSDGISYINLSSFFYERFCDPMIELLEERAITWKKWNITDSIKRNFKFEAENIGSRLDSVYLKARLTAERRYEINFDLDILCDFVNSRSGFMLTWTPGKITKQFQKILRMEKWYLKELRVLKPTLVLIVGYYADRCMALIKACKSLNIRTADVQHGVQGELHGAYASWSDIDPFGYNTLPDDFLVWSHLEVEAINQWAQKTRHEVIKTGNLFEERWFSMENEDVNDLDHILHGAIKKMRSAKTILFTIQYGIDYDEWVYKLMKNTEGEFNWLIRLHPLINDEVNIGRLEQIMSVHGITNYEIDLSSSLPIYCLLRNINLHMTHSSSTVREAENFGVNTLIFSQYGAEFFEAEIERGTCVFYDPKGNRPTTILNQLVTESYITNINSQEKGIKSVSKKSTVAYLETHI